MVHPCAGKGTALYLQSDSLQVLGQRYVAKLLDTSPAFRVGQGFIACRHKVRNTLLSIGFQLYAGSTAAKSAGSTAETWQ